MTFGGVAGGLFVALGLAGMLYYGLVFDVTIEAMKFDSGIFQKSGIEIPGLSGEPKRVANLHLMHERTVMMIGSVGFLIFGGIIGKK